MDCNKTNNVINYKTVNVKKDFGAAGNGVIDDTEAIQNALDSLKDCGGTIYFPCGTYAVSSCIIFYSAQILKFEQNAVIKRIKLKNEKEPKELRYLLASYTTDEKGSGGYNGVHDAEIIGGIFDGNEDITEDSKITVLNLCHTKNIKIKNCKVINCSVWHCLEINSSTGTLVDGCVFDGNSYTVIRDGCNELLQIDAAKIGLYGPVYFRNGDEMRFTADETCCTNIEIRYCEFICNGFAAIGGHTDYKHSDIFIHDNIFSGKPDQRGYFAFTSLTENIRYKNNKFII